MNVNSLIISCDPGIEGAFAVFKDGALAAIEDMPVMSRRVSGKDRRYVSADGIDGVLRSLLAEYLDMADETMFVLEHVGARPKEGAVGAYSFGKGVGHIEGIVIGLRLPRIEVTPVEWKRALRMNKGKDASRQRAMELYPDFRDEFQRVKDDGRAEAVLIGHWYLYGKEKRK